MEETRHVDYEEWEAKLEAILNYKYGLTVYDVEDEICLESLYFDDKRPLEVAQIIANRIL